MAKVAFGFIELLLAFDNLFVIHIAAGRYPQALQVEVHILHILCRYIQLIIRQPHHTALFHLQLPFTDFFRITAVGNSQIAGETQFYGQVCMLCLVTRQSQTLHTFLRNVITASANAVFGIIAFGSKRLNLFRIERHHLSHSHMPQGDANRTEQILRFYFFRIPVRYRISGLGKLIRSTVGKLKIFIGIFHFQLSFRLYAINGLVVKHTPVIGKESAVLAGDVYQHGRETATARSSLAPQRRTCTACVMMATAAGISGIDRAQTATRSVSAGTDIIVKSVSVIET